VTRNKTKYRFWRIWRKLKEILTRERERSPYLLDFKYGGSAQEFLRRMTSIGYCYNYWSYDEKGQVANVRRCFLHNEEIWQYHGRLYEDGELRFHREISYESDMEKHMAGETVARLPSEEIVRVYCALR